MGSKTRYLQLSNTTMMEYCMNSAESGSWDFAYIHTKLKNGHYAVFSPLSYEVKYSSDAKKTEKLSSDSLITINTLAHLAVPKDSDENEWYTFIDPDYKYVSDDILEELNQDDVRVKEYSKYCSAPETDASVFKYVSTNMVHYPWDTLKLYFTSGYDFSDTYAATIRVSVLRNTDADDSDEYPYLDLCNILYTKSNAYKYVTYMAQPVVFGNFIYDKYLEIKLPSVLGISSDSNINNDLHINPDAAVKLMFSYVSSDSKELSNIEYDLTDYLKASVNSSDDTSDTISVDENTSVIYENVNCDFSLTSYIKGAIPVGRLSSDNLGVYLAENADRPYIEFYGTWKDSPLDFSTVNRFNRDIPLYDKSLVRKTDYTYEVDKDYTPGYNYKKWVAMHEILTEVIDKDNNVIKSENYTMSQVFLSDNDQTKFYYRPVMLDNNVVKTIINMEAAMKITYTLRFMNIEDSVQFTKIGSLSISGNSLMRFIGNTTSLNFSDRLPYKVYNKIIENKQTISGSINSASTVKYVKTFYNSTDIVLDSNSTTYENTGYTLTVSQAPKSYKFVFKIKDINGNYKFMDLTDTYYKLYGKDSNKNDIVIEPTYSSNMNMVLGELEFNFTQSTISKLKAVDESERVLSIVAYNTDNSISSMYDFKYTF